jgi:hypothetical protein
MRDNGDRFGLMLAMGLEGSDFDNPYERDAEGEIQEIVRWSGEFHDGEVFANEFCAFDVASSAESSAIRRLMEAYRWCQTTPSWLVKEITDPGEAKPLFTGLYDATDHLLIEDKETVTVRRSEWPSTSYSTRSGGSPPGRALSPESLEGGYWEFWRWWSCSVVA